MGPFLGLVMLGAMFYGAYVLVRVIIALAKKQEMKPWLLRLGASFVIFVIAGAGVGASSGGSSGGSYVTSDKQDNAATTTSVPQTTPVQQKTPEELEQERIAKEEEAALQKKYDDQAKYEEWIAWQKQEAEKKAAKEKEAAEKERAEKEKYKRASAREMLSLLAENGYAAKQKYNKELLKISNVRVSWIGPNGGGFLADSGNDFETHMFWCSVSSKTKGIQLSKLRKDEYVTVYGKIDSVGEKVGERNIGGDIMGYIVNVDRIE